MKINFNELKLNPLEVGRFSMHYDDDTCLGITDHFLNNTYSEDEFKEQIGTLYYLDEWFNVADEMNIEVENVPVYDVQNNLTNRTYSDYVDGQGEGDYLIYDEL